VIAEIAVQRPSSRVTAAGGSLIPRGYLPRDHRGEGLTTAEVGVAAGRAVAVIVGEAVGVTAGRDVGLGVRAVVGAIVRGTVGGMVGRGVDGLAGGAVSAGALVETGVAVVALGVASGVETGSAALKA
jgi:hypothetical protein